MLTKNVAQLQHYLLFYKVFVVIVVVAIILINTAPPLSGLFVVFLAAVKSYNYH